MLAALLSDPLPAGIGPSPGPPTGASHQQEVGHGGSSFSDQLLS